MLSTATQVRRVLDQIRGRTYEEALILLEYLPFRACEPVLDTLISVSVHDLPVATLCGIL
jgi:large subunit ribosomal protein L22